MKQKVNPIIIVIVSAVALVVFGLTAYFMNSAPAASVPPPVPGADKSMKGLSADQQVQARMRQMQGGSQQMQGGGGN